MLPVTQVYPLSNISAGARYCSNWTIVDDVAIESTEEFRVSLYVTDPFILLGEIATVTIQDNDRKNDCYKLETCTYRNIQT